MADLIDRQTVIDLLKKNTTRDIEDIIITNNHIKLIADMPKAYDVEKVVAELEETKVNTDTVESRHHNMIIDICADIVKRGGVE